MDHRANSVQIIFCPSLDRLFGEAREKLYREGLDRLAEWEARLTGPPPEREPVALEPLAFAPGTDEGRLSRSRAGRKVYVAAGDIYQRIFLTGSPSTFDSVSIGTGPIAL